ncbi:MAG: response regulator [bacterium]
MSMAMNHIETIERLLELLAEKEQEIANLYARLNPARGTGVPALDEAARPRPRVLIAEPDTAARVVLAERFLNEHCDVATAADGIDAIEHLGRNHFQVVVFDYEITRVNPADFISVIAERRPNCAILVITAEAPESRLKQSILDCGAREVFGKPLNLELMVKIAKPSLVMKPAA